MDIATVNSSRGGAASYHACKLLRGTTLTTHVPVKRQICRRAAVRVRAAGREGSKGGRESWDLGRFARTLLYFNPPPSPAQVLEGIVSQPLAALQALFGGGVEERKTAVMSILLPVAGSGVAGSPARAGTGGGGVTLVTGATGGVGRRVVELLLRRGRPVRALVRDTAKAQRMLGGMQAGPGGSLEVVVADIAQAQTLPPKLGAGVTCVVACSAVTVGPKEGDTPDRQKYYQGIKFHDPEIKGDTPETVELVGTRNVVTAVGPRRLGLESGLPLFSADGKGMAKEIGPLDDVVMGGVSLSGFEVRANAGEGSGPAGVFSGVVSSANNGGFASVRTRNFKPKLDLSAYEGVEFRVKGDGQRYKAILRTDTGWDSISYCRSFDTKAGEWQSVRLPFREFAPIFRARSLRDGAPLDASGIASVQLMLSKFEYDGALNPNFRTGRFELPVAHITAYLPTRVTPRLVFLSSAGVTRPDRPGIDVNAEPPAVKMNAELGGILTYKLAAEDVVRTAGVPFAIVRPTALTEEPPGAELVLDQGDTIKGKISRDDVAELLVALLDEPAATDTTFEIKSTVPFSQPWTVDPTSPPAARDWGALLRGAGLGRGVTGKTVNGVYTGREPDPSLAVDADKQQPVAV